MPDLDPLQHWAVANLTLVRSLMLVCSLGWLAVLVAWLKPDERARRAGVLAVIVQLGVGTALDALCVRLGAWSYRDMPLLVAGVPVDLHVAWAVPWGFGLVWLADRWPGPRAAGRVQAAFLLGCVALTLAFDVAIHRWLLFVDGAAAWWWLADAAFLTVILGLTLWVHRSTGSGAARTCGLGSLPPLSPRVRGGLLTGTFVAVFFVLLPDWIVLAAEHFGVAERAPALPVLPELLGVAGALLLLWGVHEFARVGRATPVPWDAPRQLVISGPYAFCANPMQTGGVLLSLACAAAYPTWVGLVYALDIALVVAVVFRPAEARQLAVRYGSKAAQWSLAVRPFRWRRRPYHPLDASRAVIVFDADCGPCRRWVQRRLAADDVGTLDATPLHGERARSLLPPGSHAASGKALALWEPGVDGAPPLITTGGEAVLRIFARLPLPFSLLAAAAAVPGALTLVEAAYAVVARLRPHGHCRLTDRATPVGGFGPGAPSRS